MVILRSEIWYFSSKIQNLEHPITLSVNSLEIDRILGKSTKSAPKSRKINFLHNILSFPVFREVLDSIYVVHKCVGCFYTIATNFGFLGYTAFLYKSLVPVTLTAGLLPPETEIFEFVCIVLWWFCSQKRWFFNAKRKMQVPNPQNFRLAHWFCYVTVLRSLIQKKKKF